MLVSDSLGYGYALLALGVAGTRLGRVINATIYTHHELAKRIKQGEAFVTRALAQPKVWLMGDDDDLRV